MSAEERKRTQDLGIFIKPRWSNQQSPSEYRQPNFIARSITKFNNFKKLFSHLTLTVLVLILIDYMTIIKDCKCQIIVDGSQLPQYYPNGTTPSSNQFVIKFIHNDSKNNLSYVSIVPVNSTNLHEPRIELRYQSKYPSVNLDERTSNNTVVAAVVVNDEDSGPNGETSLFIEHGNELGHFKLVSTQFTNTIQVNGAPLSKHRVPEYNLTIVARDHGSPPKSSAVNLVIKLSTSSPPMGTNAPLEPQPSLKPPVTDLMYVGAMLVVIFSALVLFIIISCALVQRPKSKKGPPPRSTSSTNSRMHPSDHCLCLGHTNL